MKNFDPYYTKLKWVSITLYTVSAALIAIMLVITISLYSGRGDTWDVMEGVWYCDALSLTIDTECSENSYIIQNNERMPIIHGEMKESAGFLVYKPEEMQLQNGTTILRYGEVLFNFQYLSHSDSLYIATDETGQIYNFVRID